MLGRPTDQSCHAHCLDLEGSIPLKNHHETMKCMGQENNNKGWLWMLSYWSIGGSLGTLLGYLPKTIGPFTWAHAAALRQPQWGSCQGSFFVYQLRTTKECAGVIYLAIYDLGAVVLGRNSAISFLLGLLTFNSYSYLIRKNFWPPRVFPVHMKADNAPFVRKGLPEVTIS